MLRVAHFADLHGELHTRHVRHVPVHKHDLNLIIELRQSVLPILGLNEIEISNHQLIQYPLYSTSHNLGIIHDERLNLTHSTPDLNFLLMKCHSSVIGWSEGDLRRGGVEKGAGGVTAR